MAEAGRQISLNGKLLTEAEIVLFEQAIRGASNKEAFLGSSDLFYDDKAGFWGESGKPSAGMLEPGLLARFCDVPEMRPYTCPANMATGVFINERELEYSEAQQIHRMGVPAEPAHWVVNERGFVLYPKDIERGIQAEAAAEDGRARLTVDITAYYQDSSGAVRYMLLITCGNQSWGSDPRFSEFLMFDQVIRRTYPYQPLPRFPSKRIHKFDQNREFCVTRMNELKKFMAQCLKHKCVRECTDALAKIMIYEKIIPNQSLVVRPRIIRECWNKPLLQLSGQHRRDVALLFMIISEGWHDSLKEWVKLEMVMLSRLHLNDSLQIHVRRVYESNYIDIGRSVNNMTVEGLKSLYSTLMEQKGEDLLTSLVTLPSRYRNSIIWELLLSAVACDSLSSHVFKGVQQMAFVLHISMTELETIEKQCADALQAQMVEHASRQSTESQDRKMKIGAAAAIGGGVLLVAGFLAAPLIVPVLMASATIVGAGATVVAGSAVGASVVAAGTTLIAASAPMLPILFGAGGAGIGAWKAHKLTAGVSEFGFEFLEQSADKKEHETPQELCKIDWAAKEVVMINKMDNDDIDKMDPSKLEPRNLSDEDHRSSRSSSSDFLPQGPSISHSSPSKDSGLESESGTHSRSSVVLGHQHPGLHVFLMANGWLWKEEDLTQDWQGVYEAVPSGEHYVVNWESRLQLSLGHALVDTLTKVATMQLAKWWVAYMSSVAAAAISAFAIPMASIGALSIIDNQWTLVDNRAEKSGSLLAMALKEKAAGHRPVTLIGFSLGAKVIFQALEQLKAEANSSQYRGIVSDVFIIGGAITSDAERWDKVRDLVSGRLVNAFCRADFVLGYIHRAAGKTLNVAGIVPVESSLVENVDLTSVVSGHLGYKSNMTTILRMLDVGCSIPGGAGTRSEATGVQQHLRFQDYVDQRKLLQELRQIVSDMRREVDEGKASEHSMTPVMRLLFEAETTGKAMQEQWRQYEVEPAVLDMVADKIVMEEEKIESLAVRLRSCEKNGPEYHRVLSALEEATILINSLRSTIPVIRAQEPETRPLLEGSGKSSELECGYSCDDEHDEQYPVYMENTDDAEDYAEELQPEDLILFDRSRSPSPKGWCAHDSNAEEDQCPVDVFSGTSPSFPIPMEISFYTDDRNTKEVEQLQPQDLVQEAKFPLEASLAQVEEIEEGWMPVPKRSK